MEKETKPEQKPLKRCAYLEAGVHYFRAGARRDILQPRMPARRR